MPEPTEGPTVLRILLGTQLRRLRETRGITAQEAARAIRGSESKISRIELGRNAIREIDVLDLLTHYGVGAVEREQLLSLAEQASRPGWWHRYNDILPGWFQSYVGMEEAATSIRSYEPQFIPGLLQTCEYAAAVLAVGDIPVSETERHVILRKERQRRFTEGRLTLWAIIEETALRQPMGSVEILRDQLRYLLSQAQQLLPFDRADAVVGQQVEHVDLTDRVPAELDPADLRLRPADRPRCFLRGDAAALPEPPQLGSQQDPQHGWPFRRLWHDASRISAPCGIVSRNCVANCCHSPSANVMVSHMGLHATPQY